MAGAVVNDDPRWRVRHLPVLLAACALMLVGTAAGGWAERGWPGAVGGATGVAIVTASYTVSTLAIAWADSVNRRLVLPVGVGIYIWKISLIGVAMASVPPSWPGLVPLGWGVIIGVVTWTGVQIWWVYRRAPRPGDLS